ncbi:unnamed protein product [Urochloa humidicola]
MSSRVRLSAAFVAAAASTAPSPRAPHIALAAATERGLRSAAFGPEDARHLLDELRQRRDNTCVPVRALNGFLAALAKAPRSAACSDGPALAVTFFNGLSRAASPRLLSTTFHTYVAL